MFVSNVIISMKGGITLHANILDDYQQVSAIEVVL
jgi:hypothetical protein